MFVCRELAYYIKQISARVHIWELWLLKIPWFVSFGEAKEK